VNSITYKDAGVDIEAGDRFVDRIKPFVNQTNRKGVIGSIGGFGGLFQLPSGYKEPVLVSSTDGVGTKLKLANDLRCHNGVGIDLVAMCVNDILVQGATPLFFLDYIAISKLDPDIATNVVRSIAMGCKIANCALLGGETAEMPGMYHNGEYDLAGFAVGIVEKSKIITGNTIKPGDYVIGFPSSGFHSNGYSLVRKLLAQDKPNTAKLFDDDSGQTFAEVLMRPTIIYSRIVTNLINNFNIKGFAHITGGGLTGNIPRILPSGVNVELFRDSWARPKIFDWAQRVGNIAETEMLRVFNCGIGMIAIVSPDDITEVTLHLHQDMDKVSLIGMVVESDEKEPKVILK